MFVLFIMNSIIHMCACSGAYPEIFRGRGFEIFLYKRGGFRIFFLKSPSKLKNFPKKVGVLTPKTAPWIRPCACLCYFCSLLLKTDQLEKKVSWWLDIHFWFSLKLLPPNHFNHHVNWPINRQKNNFYFTSRDAVNERGDDMHQCFESGNKLRDGRMRCFKCHEKICK